MPVRQVLAGQPATLTQYGLHGSFVSAGKAGWDGMRFDVLWPVADVVLSDDNSHSCVLRVASRTQAILISGDAPRAVETHWWRITAGNCAATFWWWGTMAVALPRPRHGWR
jgi:competence protein ComEC